MALPFMTPSPGINYNFVAGSYLVCSLILVVLLALDKVREERLESTTAAYMCRVVYRSLQETQGHNDYSSVEP